MKLSLKNNNQTKLVIFKKINTSSLQNLLPTKEAIKKRYIGLECHNLIYIRPVYIGSCACVVKIVVKCSFEYLSVVHHTRRHPTTINM